MDASLPFRPQGTGVWLAVTNNAPTAATRSPDGPTGGDVSYEVYCPSGQADAFIGYGPTSASAVANAIAPLALGAGAPPAGQGGGFFISPSGTIKSVTLAPNLFFAGRSLGSCSVWIQPGYGV